MMRATWVVTIVALGALSVGPTVAKADVRTEARRAFRSGMQMVQDGDVDGGIARLEEAYDILPHPNVLYNIARAYAEAGRYEEGLEYFERYLAADPPDREEVEGFVAALQDRLAATQAEAEVAVEVETETETGTEAPAISSEELQAIEDSANQISALAEATQSEALRERAARLRLLAESLRARQAAALAAASETETNTETGTETGTEEAGALALGEVREGDTYEEAVVSASRMRESPLDAPNSTTIITAQDIRLSGLTNLGELVRRAAGVEVMTHMPSHTDVSVRGLNQRQSNKVLVLVNGRSVRLDFLGSPFLQLLPLNVEDIERIEIIRGPASAVYGADAFSGIINVILRDPGESDSYVTIGGGNGDRLRGATSVAGRSEGLSYRFSAGYDQQDHYALEVAPSRVDFSSFNDDGNQSIQKLSFTGTLDYNFEAGNIDIGAAVLQGEAGLQGISRIRQLSSDDLLFIQTHASVTTELGLFARTYWTRFGVVVDTIDQPPGGLNTVGFITSDVINSEIGFARQFELGVPHNFSTGVNYTFKRIDWNWLGDDTKTESHFAFFMQDIMQLHELLRLTLSFRIDRHPLLPNVQFSPRGSLVMRIAEGQSIRFTGGTAFRSPAFLESYLQRPNRTSLRGGTAVARGRTDLDPERMLSFELGYMNQATDYFALEANAYLNYIDDAILLTDFVAHTLGDYGDGTVGYLEDEAAYSLGDLSVTNEGTRFRQLGGELGIRVFPVTGLDLYVNYSLSDTSPTETAALQSQGDRRLDQRTPLHKVNAGIQYRSSFGLDISLDMHWVDSQVWVEQVTDVATGVRFQAFDLPAYTLVNARIGYRLMDDALEVALVGTNLLFDDARQHPFGQPMDSRFMASGTFRF